MNNVIHSRNFFVDTAIDHTHGDNAEIQLAGHSITCGDGQLIKLSLLSFDMYKNFYGINYNNSRVLLACKSDANATNLGSVTVTIPSKNYGKLGDIAEAFSSVLSSSLHTFARAASSTATVTTVSDLTPSTAVTMDGTSDRILSFTVTFDAPHKLTSVDISCEDDSHLVLGGDHVRTFGTDSLNISIPTAETILIEGRYPMQLTTEHNVFLRFDKQSTNLETASMSRATGPYESHVLNSNILAMIPQDFEYCSYNSSTGEEYFAVLSTKTLTSLRLFLTDGSNRPLGRIANSASRSAAGGGAEQSSLGNLSFRAVLRVDVIQVNLPRTLESKPFTRTVDPKNEGIMTHL